MKFCQQCGSTYPTDFLTCPRDQTALSQADDIAIGMTLRDKYIVIEKLGAGGMASVYKVRRVPFNDIYALKLVNKGLAADPQFVKRFRAEAVMAHKLDHPNIVRIVDLDTTEDGRPLMVMELIDGSDLRSLITRTGALPVETALDVAAQVADGLDCAHRAGIVHRDIKPDNILLASNGKQGHWFVKIADFGIAKAREAAPGATIGTSTGMVIGTPQYMSPEHSMGIKSSELDGRADLYSLAVVLYEMLTGQLPFKSDTAVGFLLQHMQADPPAPRTLNPQCEIPDAVVAVLMKGLAKDREQRFQTGAEFAAALRNPEAWAAQHQPSAAAAAAAATIQFSPPPSAPVPGVRAGASPSNVGPVGGFGSPAAAGQSARSADTGAPAVTIASAAAPAHAQTATSQPAAATSAPAAAAAKPKSSSAGLIIALLVVVLLGGIGVGAWYFLHRPKPAQSAAVVTAPVSAAPTSAAPSASNTPTPQIPDAAAASGAPKPPVAKNSAKSGTAATPPPTAAPASNSSKPVTAPSKPEAAPPKPAPPAPKPVPAAAPLDPKVVGELRGADYKLANADYSGALKSYEKVLKMDPGNADAQRGVQKAQAGKDAKSFVVDAGSFRRKADADALIANLKSKGFDNAQVFTIDRAFHVQLGPMDRKKASKTHEKLQQKGFESTIIPMS